MTCWVHELPASASHEANFQALTAQCAQAAAAPRGASHPTPGAQFHPSASNLSPTRFRSCPQARRASSCT